MAGKRFIVFRLILSLFSMVFVLLVVEVVLRLAPSAPGPDPLGDRSSYFYVPDEACRHLWTRGATNILRLAAIGDSFTAGAGVQVDDRYAERLERLLNTRAGMTPAEVHVFAKNGTSTFQQVGLLDDALKEKPRIILLGICLNDMEDWARPEVLKQWRHRILATPPRMVRHSRALSWMYLKLKWAECHRMERRYFRRLYDPSYSGFHRFQEAIEDMNTKCAEARVAFIPVIFPLLSDTDSFREGHYAFEYAHAAIRGRCKELNIPCLDLLQAFRAATPDRLSVMPKFDPHPNEIGHRMAAEAILQFLIDGGFVAPEYKPPVRPSAMQQLRIWQRSIRAEDTIARGATNPAEESAEGKK